MPTKLGPKDENITNLVFGYDISDEDLSYDGYPVENSVSKNETLRRYNNPGFSGYNRNTGRVHPDTNTPIWELAFYPQDEGRVPRLTSSEGYGCYHGMGRNLYADKKYLASIMMKEGPGTRFIDNDMNHGYSNIGGWNSNGTTRTKEYVGNGWWRFYTIWSNGTTAYSPDGVTPLATRYSGNTYSTHELPAGEHIVSSEINPYQYVPGGTSNFRGNYQFSPYIINDYDSVGAQFLDWGLDEEMTKPVFDPVFNYPNPVSPIRFFFKVNMPAPGSIRIRNRAYSVSEYLSDAKYWKIRFSDTALNKRELMWVTAPMIHEIPSTGYKKPWKYVDGAREGGLKNIVDGTIVNLSTASKSPVNKGFMFDGTDDFIRCETPQIANSRSITFMAWVKSDGLLSDARRGIFRALNTPGGYMSFMGYTNNRILFETRDPVTSSYKGVNTSTMNIYNGEWVLVGFQIKPSAMSVFYINNTDGFTYVETPDTRSAFTFQNFDIGVDASNFDWNGYIENVRLYKADLSQEEIEKFYKDTKSRYQ